MLRNGTGKVLPLPAADVHRLRQQHDSELHRISGNQTGQLQDGDPAQATFAKSSSSAGDHQHPGVDGPGPTSGGNRASQQDQKLQHIAREQWTHQEQRPTARTGAERPKHAGESQAHSQRELHRLPPGTASTENSRP
uniref:(northern house mosquito) hypothetical protein n=1 Tax=Culex pipiens TaxID=7175 RepID=A0A8D8IF67_CULPI